MNRKMYENCPSIMTYNHFFEFFDKLLRQKAYMILFRLGCEVFSGMGQGQGRGRCTDRPRVEGVGEARQADWDRNIETAVVQTAALYDSEGY